MTETLSPSQPTSWCCPYPKHLPMNNKITVRENCGASVSRGATHGDSMSVKGRFLVTCRGRDGAEKWSEVINNLVTTLGKNDILNKYLTGSSYTAAFRMGLKGAGTAALADTQASHAGWLEVGGANAPTYTGARKDVTMNAASGGSASSPTQVFAITSSGTIAGCFTNMGGLSTKDDTSGVLFSAGDFSGGSKSVSDGDTLSVSYTLSV